MNLVSFQSYEYYSHSQLIDLNNSYLQANKPNKHD